MKRYFTSDWHLGSTNILRYADRPYVFAEEAAKALVDNCNKVAKSRSDVVFHVGDFYLKKSDKHDKIEDINHLVNTDEDFIELVNARMVLLDGNHDDGHNCATDLKSMTLNLNQNYVNVTVSHYPSYHDEYRYVGNSNRKSLSKGMVRKFGQDDNIHIHLCGHVHDRWLLCYDAKHNVLNINVGVDVWDYRPVNDAEITRLLDFVFSAKVKMPKDTLTKTEVDIWKKQNECIVCADRSSRKAERYAKKGLTPEECQRRKEAALKAKGFI